jgi:hypothetical protein
MITIPARSRLLPPLLLLLAMVDCLLVFELLQQRKRTQSVQVLRDATSAENGLTAHRSAAVPPP